MRQVRASGSLGSGRVTADSFPRGSWPGLLRDLALQFPWVPVGASAFGLAGRPLVTSPPGPRHFLSASGCWAPSTLEAAPMSRSRTALSVPLPASPPGPQKTPLLGVASPGVGIDSARLSRERVGRLAHRPAASPLRPPLLRQGLPRTFGSRVPRDRTAASLLPRAGRRVLGGRLLWEFPKRSRGESLPFHLSTPVGVFPRPPPPPHCVRPRELVPAPGRRGCCCSAPAGGSAPGMPLRGSGWSSRPG